MTEAEKALWILKCGQECQLAFVFGNLLTILGLKFGQKVLH